VTGFSASPAGPGTNSKHCRSRCGTPAPGDLPPARRTGPPRSPSRFPKRTRCLAPTFFIPLRWPDHLVHGHGNPEGQVVIVVQYVKGGTGAPLSAARRTRRWTAGHPDPVRVTFVS